MPDPSPTRPRRTWWTWCRRGIRWARIGSLALVFLVLAGLTWLRVWGLPSFLRERIVAELAQHGVDAQFSDLRFHWVRGFVATDLRVAWGGARGPRLAIVEADLDLAPPPWRETRELVRGLAIRTGSLVVPLPLTNEPTADLRIDDLSADIRFPRGDAWIVRRLAAKAFGLDLEFRGTVTNLSAFARPRTKASSPPDPRRLRQLRGWIEEVARWSGPTPPRLTIQFDVDAARPTHAHGDVFFEVPRLVTPHGEIQGLRLALRAPPPDADPAAPSRASVTFDLDAIQSGQGGLERASGRLDLLAPPRPALPTNVAWHADVGHLYLRDIRARQLRLRARHDLLATPSDLSAAALASVPVRSGLELLARELEAVEIQSRRCQATNLDLSLVATHRASAELPSALEFRLATGPVSGSPGSLGPLLLSGDVTRRDAASVPTNTPPNLAAWIHAWPYAGRLHLALTNLASPKLAVARLATDLRWAPPRLDIERLDADLYSGRLQARGGLDVPAREARLDAETTFDLHGIDALLGPRSRENFVRYQWKQPPWFQGSARVVLPEWTDRQPDWDGVVKPTLRLDGRFRVEHGGGFKGVAFDRAESSLHFDGANWRLPDLETARPEGRQSLAVDYNEDTRAYRIDARGRISPPVLRPLIGEKTAEILDLFEFPEPVDAVVSVWGPWSEGNRQSIVGHLLATNFQFRAQHFHHLDARVVYTNQFLGAGPVLLRRDAGQLTCDGVGYSFPDDRLWLTNAVNTIHPQVVAAAISPGFPEKLVHYRFDQPPRIVASGTLKPRDTATADMDFDIEGGPFHFWRFSADTIRTRLLWRGQTLTLTNIQARFYQGDLDGHAFFDLAQPADSPYRFAARVRDARLEDLLHEATRGRTNIARGNFDLDLAIRDARTSDLWTWNGDGRAELRDGLLWDTPIFGFLSPVLNAVAPGLGNNRAKHATATFAITNGVFHTRDMDISCPPAKLLYRGSIDLEQRVQAKVEGQVLTDFPAIGPLFGLLLRPLTKLMEFRVTGTLTDVEAEPVYVPKFVLLPLQPFKAIRQIFKPPEGPVKTTPLPTDADLDRLVPTTNAPAPLLPVPDPVTEPSPN